MYPQSALIASCCSFPCASFKTDAELQMPLVFIKRFPRESPHFSQGFPSTPHSPGRPLSSPGNTVRCDRICTLCSAGLGDEGHMLFECEALRDLREEHTDLFQGVLSVKEFMWLSMWTNA